MTVDCGGAGWGGLFATAFGLFFLWAAFMAWFRPNSRFIQSTHFERYPREADANRIALFFGYTREFMGPTALWGTRFIALFGGLLFAGVGITALMGEFAQCAHPNFAVHFPNFATGLHFRYWPPMLPFVAAACTFAIFMTLKVRSATLRIATVALVVAWAVAATEAAAFHVGSEAKKWGIIAFICFASGAVVTWLGRVKRDDNGK